MKSGERKIGEKMTTKINCRAISNGRASGEALISAEPISFYGGVDPDSGIVIEKGHCLEGKSIAGKVLIFPYGKGSTVGSYILYRLKKNGKAPAAIINQETEPIVAVGAIISKIPLVDKPEEALKGIKNNQKITVDGSDGIIIIE
jgi:predicted aconitase with swiveling domain